MIVTTSGPAARTASVLRFALLSVVGVFLGHEAVYLAAHGQGHRFVEAMSAGGHDGYWTWFTVLAVGSSILASALAAMELRRAGRAARGKPVRSGRPVPYRLEVRRLWRGLFPVLVVAYLLQENIESAASAGRLSGVGPVFDAHGAAVPILALVALALATFGALVRWRLERISGRRGTPDRPIVVPRAPADRPAAGWWVVPARLSRSWILLGQAPGRAPPA
jgi:hypothetical protein